MLKSRITKGFILIIILFLISFLPCSTLTVKAVGYPYYKSDKGLCVRSSFYTMYSTSSSERKSNIKLATRSLNNYFLDVGAEFSFNKTVGERTEKRGYKTSKIIFNGKFIEGIGGGVCQVSSTLYNAVILAGLLITECHPHSLPVSYVSPSFDAMVNSGTADLRFINNTSNPIIINACATDERVKITIYGEQMMEKIITESLITAEIEAPEEQQIEDEKGEYPDLHEGEKRVITYSKKGLKSKGYLIKYREGKMIEKIKIREDKYSAMRGVIVLGKAKREEEKQIEIENIKLANQNSINTIKNFDKRLKLC